MLILPEFPGLKFEEKRHIYTLDGQQLPSVTTLMRPLSAAVYKGIDEEVLNRAAVRGTAVHNAIENYAKFGIVDIEPKYEGYLQAYLKWEKDNGPALIANESRAYHKQLRYAGTMDMACMIDGIATCVDFKTSYKVEEILVRVQLEAYVKAFASHGFAMQNKIALQLKKDGSYNAFCYQGNDNEAWQIFGTLCELYGYIKKYWG